MIAVIVLGGAAFAYFQFFRTSPQGAAVAGAPASAGQVAANTTPATPAQPSAPIPAPIAATPNATSAPGSAAPAMPPAAPAEQPAVAQAPTTAAPAEVAPAPVDHTLEVAAGLVRRGEREYAQGDYENAYRHARSALDVHPGYASAERLLRRAENTQQQVAAQQAQVQARVAAGAAAGQAATEAAQPPKPTPDEIYNQRAHSECARGLFGKSCRHKIRVAVCQGVAPDAAGATVCKGQDD